MFTCAKSRTNFRYFNIMNNDFGKESDGLPMQTVVICFWEQSYYKKVEYGRMK